MSNILAFCKSSVFTILHETVYPGSHKSCSKPFFIKKPTIQSNSRLSHPFPFGILVLKYTRKDYILHEKILYVLMITSLFLLSACGSSSTSSNPDSTESKTILSNHETESLSAESQALPETESALPDNQSDDSTLSDSADSLDDLTRQAEELAATSEKITEGELYDSISAIYSDVVIHTDSNNDLSIQINLNHDTVEADSLTFFETIISMCSSCALESYSSNISFTMMVDGEFITILSMLDYASLASFSTTEPLYIADEYEETIKYIYSNLFSKNDIMNQFDKRLESLGE